ncbi:retrovirus-related pol polyprotein from transposon TNT 1-94, partial [Tanacetum coccineum]
SSADNSDVSITGSNKPKLSEAEDSTLPNYDTATDYDSADESLVCSTPFPLLEKLAGTKPVFGPKTIKLNLKSNPTFKAETLKGITLKEPSSVPTKDNNKGSSASKTFSALAGKLKNVKIKDDPPLAIMMKELSELKLQLSKKKSSHSKNHRSQQHKETLLAFEQRMLKAHDLYQRLLAQIWEVPGPEGMYGDDSTYTTEGHGYVKLCMKAQIMCSSDQNGQDNQIDHNDQNDHLFQTDEFLNDDQLVAQGYNQQEGIAYDETFAPIARLEAIRIFLAFATYMNFIVYQMDVKNAFLNGKLKEEVYVKQPPGFENSEFPNHVCKALYGLKQAPKVWYETLSTYLTKHKFVRDKIDKTLFIYITQTDVILVKIYVDDIIVGSTSTKLCKQFAKLMTQRYEMSMIGVLTYFLGFQIKKSKRGISINKERYVKHLLKKYDKIGSSVKTSLVPPNMLGPDLNDKAINETQYKGMIGSLMYLTASRHDIQFSTCLYARYQAKPKEPRLISVKRIFMYLKEKAPQVLVSCSKANLYAGVLKSINL